MHSTSRQRKRDRRLWDKLVFLLLDKRRFHCRVCGRVFTESDPVFGMKRRSSHRFREYLGKEAHHQTVKRVAEKEQVGEGLVRRCPVLDTGYPPHVWSLRSSPLRTWR